MAYYTALITAWNASSASTGVLPTGVAGTSLFGLTTANKIAAVNSWTVTGTIPTSFHTTGPAIANCLNWTEFNALTAAQQSNLLQMCAISDLLGGSGNTAFLAPGMILAYFTNHSGPTVTALSALASAQVQPWWQVSVANGGGGLSGPINQSDVTLAGLS